MPLKIKEVYKNGIGFNNGLEKEDELITINDNDISDILDYNFYIIDEKVKLKVKKKNGNIVDILINKDYGEFLDIDFYDIKYARCKNNCIFCFINQLPKGLRETLYFKDEDYRLSFLFGNYITMTSIKDKDLQRIVRQRLSPIYISVHTVNSELRAKMLGIKKETNIIEKIKYLAENDIYMHTQVVLCPEINDGVYLDETINTLASFYPKVKTLAIVPVGLTKFRENLPKLRVITKEEAVHIIRKVSNFQKKFKKKFGVNFVYLADEFYIKAGIDLPNMKHYDEFEQLENGVGMITYLNYRFKNFMKKKTVNKKKYNIEKKVTIITGYSAESFIKNILDEVNIIAPNIVFNLIAVENKFFGENITVTGLLTAQDIHNALKNQEIGDYLLLPENCLNHDGLFLDNEKFDDFKKKYPETKVLAKDLITFFKDLLK